MSKLNRTKNPNTKDLLNELNGIIHSTIMVDKIDILNEIISLMKFCSKYDMIFLFLFDEVDLWLNTNSDTAQLSQKFLIQQKFMKRILEIPKSQVKTVFLFACTARVNELLYSQQQKFTTSSPAASRLIQFYNTAEKIMEPGCYDSEIRQALIKIATYYLSVNEKKDFSHQFFTEVAPILEAKYRAYSRRTTNSRIIQILDCYQYIRSPLAHGMKVWKNNTRQYGTLIEDHLDALTKRMNIKFVREQIPVDPTRKYSKDKLDGFFITYDASSNEVKIPVEIKVSKEFKGNKAYQILPWLTLNPDQKIVYIVFSPTPRKEIEKEIAMYADKEGFSLDLLKNIELIHISNPYAFASISYLADSTLEPDQILGFYDHFAFWLDFIGDFSSKYHQMINDLGLDIFSQNSNTHKEESGTGSTSEPSSPPKYEFSLDERIGLNLMTALFLERSFTPSGRMNKTKIDKVNSKRSLGIADLEKTLEFLRKKDLIMKINPKSVQFDKEIIEIETMDTYSEKIRAVMQNSKAGADVNSFF